MNNSPYSYKVLTVAVTNDAATTATIDMRGVRDAVVYVPNGSSITSLVPHAAPGHDANDTYEPLHDSTGAATVTVAADRALRLPASYYGIGSLKFVGNAAGNIQMSFMQ